MERLIEEDELSNILNSNHNLRNNFKSYRLFNGTLTLQHKFTKIPLLHVAVQEKSQKVVEYLLSQNFVDKSICNAYGENIYHVICRIRGAEELFSIIERNVPHHLFLDNSMLGGKNTFHIACKENNIFIVKRVHEILKSLKVDLTLIKKNVMEHAIKRDDVEVVKYVLSIDGIK